MATSPDQKLLLAFAVAGLGLYASARIRSDVGSAVASVVGLGLAQWLASSAREATYPEVPAARLERAVTGADLPPQIGQRVRALRRDLR